MKIEINLENMRYDDELAQTTIDLLKWLLNHLQEKKQQEIEEDLKRKANRKSYKKKVPLKGDLEDA